MEATDRFAYRWTLRPVEDDGRVAALSERLNKLPASLARTLLLRGVDTLDEARHFFRAGLEDGLHDPFLMKDMDAGAERLAQAIETGEGVLVYGDYDVDGTTSTALMTLFLRAHGVDAQFFIPNRFEHGYGLCEAGIDEAVAHGAGLIVALDCGITAVEEAAYAKSKGLDLIICDHHTPGPTLPEAAAVLNPKRSDCTYPFDGLSGCGVGFKLIQGTLQKLGRPASDAWPYLDLVAVSTAADIVPVVNENRVLLREGLRLVQQQPRLGLSMLAQRAGVDLGSCSASQVVFSLGPRINAAGRLDSATLAASLLASDDNVEAARLADRLEVLNTQRRDLDHQTRDEAIALAQTYMTADPYALVLLGEHWHPGVIGITASRVAERFHRPSVLLSAGRNGLAKGSARSVKGISIYDALATCSDLLVRFGGHAFAAGLALPVEKVPALRERLSAAVADAVPDPDTLVPELELDAELDVGHINERFWRVLNQFGPFGPDNPRPLFWGRNLRVVGRPKTVGADGSHLKLRVASTGGGPTFSLIGFGLGDRLDLSLKSVRRGRPLEVAFGVEENHWNGRTSLQLRAKDVRLEGGE